MLSKFDVTTQPPRALAHSPAVF